MLARRILLTLAACFSAALGGLSAARAQTATFNFDTVPVGRASPLTLTQNGVTVTFTDDHGVSQDDGQFAVGPVGHVFSSRFSGNLLSSASGYAGQYRPLVILFQQPAREISLDFGTTDLSRSPSPVVFSAFNGATLVGTETITPQTLVFLPEGSLDFSSAMPFDSVWLSSPPSQFLMVDNVTVTEGGSSPVPEAPPAAVFAVGLLSLAGLGVRARRRAA